jgi:hypothetical protein
MNEQSKVDDIDQIRFEKNIAREAAAMIPVTGRGVEPQDFSQVADRAKYMALAKEAVPAHLRGNVGMCIAIHEMAMEWGLRPYGVANLCYVVNNRLAFEAQLQIAVINKHAGLKERLRPIYEGEGDDLVCIVRGHFKDETEPCEYRSPPINQISPKNSPLWRTDPKRQLFFYSGRAFVKMFCSHVLLGIFGVDELADNPHIGADNAKDVTNGLHERLAAAAGQEGFKPGVVDAGLNGDADPSATPGGPVAGQSHDPATPGGRKKHKKPQEPAQPTTTEGVASPAPAQENAPAASPGPVEGKPRPTSPVSSAEETSQSPTTNDGAPSSGRVTSTLPKTPEEYIVYARAWLQTATSADGIEARWRAERTMRNAVGLTEEMRAPLEVQKKARMVELGSDRK